MEAVDLAAHRVSAKTVNRRLRISRATLVGLAIVWIGSMGYTAYALRDGEVEHRVSSENPRERTTSVGFPSWHGIIPAPEWPEYSYQEVQLASGEWVKHGRYGRITRKMTALEHGTYREGRREGRWTYWDANGGLDVDRSGFYSDDVRVRPGPSSPTDPEWALMSNLE